MSKNFKNKYIIALLVGLVSILLVACSSSVNSLERTKDTEFKDSSGIRFTDITDTQTENMYLLCKVWGFAKYRHPSITDGTINWDAELFRVMPLVLESSDNEQTTDIIFEWINQFNFATQESDAEIMKLKDELSTTIKTLEADLSWIDDTEVLGEDLSEYLVSLSEVVVMNHSNGYADFDSEYLSLEDGNIFVDMDHEDPYSNMTYDDTGMRLLGLFRYWNIIEYFFPYKDIMDEDWDEVLVEMIPKFVLKESDSLVYARESYVLSLAQLSTHINDTHVHISNSTHELYKYFGKYMPPVRFMDIDGQIVISEVGKNKSNIPSKLKQGDIILSMDGIEIEDRIENCKKYISISNDDRFSEAFASHLLGTNNDTALMEVLRDGESLTLTVECGGTAPQTGQELSEFIENDQIGYINPATLESGDIDKLMVQFKDTKGLVVDLRNYPSDNIVYSLAEYLIPDATPFVKFGISNPFVPGEFIETPLSYSGQINSDSSIDKPLYKNKVVILMDNGSMSHPEFTIMSLRNAPNAVVLGSTSMGADGNVVYFMLPGGVTTTITGISVFYPDGTQTQRVGLEPDIYLEPTINGLKEGRDELLEEAVSIILGE